MGRLAILHHSQGPAFQQSRCVLSFEIRQLVEQANAQSESVIRWKAMLMAGCCCLLWTLHAPTHYSHKGCELLDRTRTEKLLSDLRTAEGIINCTKEPLVPVLQQILQHLQLHLVLF